MQSHDDKIQPRTGRPTLGSPVTIVDARLERYKRKRGRVVGMRSSAIDVPTLGAETPHSTTHYAVLYIVLFEDGSAMPFAENEVELWTPPLVRRLEPRELIARPGQIQPPQLIVSPRDAK